MNDTTAGVRGEALPPAGAGRSPASIAFPPLLDMSLAMLLVGATAPLGELALAGMPLFPALAVRLALAGAALTLVRSRCAGPVGLTRRHWAVLALQALCGVVVFNAGMWLGMREGGAAAAGIFTSATPAVMAVIGMIAFGERLSRGVVWGVCLTTAGVMAARGAWSGGWNPGWGDAMLAAAVLGESVFLLAVKWLPGWLSPMDAARRITWIGMAMVLPLAAWQGAGFDWTRVGLASWGAVAALGVLVTAGGYVLWFRGVAGASAGQAAVITGLLPVSAVASSWLLLGVAPTHGQGMGCLAVGAGIWLASRRG